MDKEHEYLTKEKFEELKKELEFLKTDKRKEVAESLEYAKGLGDLSENAEYHEARETQASIEDRIAKLESILETAIIVSEKHGGIVNIGSTVVVKKDKSDATQTFSIVGSEEVDVSHGKISIHSPLGGVLIGKKKSEHIVFKSPSGQVGYTIIDVK